MWMWSWIETLIFLIFKSIIWILLHWYVFFSIIIAIIIYEFWWKRKQEIKESQFIIGDSKKQQEIKESQLIIEDSKKQQNKKK
jgi:hypothetical protein